MDVPKSQIDIMNSDSNAMRRLDVELLRRGIYVLPGVRRFVSSVISSEDIDLTAEVLDEACKAMG